MNGVAPQLNFAARRDRLKKLRIKSSGAGQLLRCASGEQRFAKSRGQRDAEDRATQVVAESIRNRLASYFVAGT